VTEEVNIATLKMFLRKREPRNLEQRRLDVCLALRDSTGKVFGNLLVSIHLHHNNPTDEDLRGRHAAKDGVFNIFPGVFNISFLNFLEPSKG